MASQFDNSEAGVIGWARSVERVGNDERLLLDLAQFFVEDAPALLIAVDDALQQGDAEQLAISAHSLKGLASNFDAEACVTAARAVEERALARDLATAANGVPELKRAVASVTQALQTRIAVP